MTVAIIQPLITAFETAPDPSRVKALVISNPHNPLGLCYTSEVLRALMVFCQERGLHLLVDEVYALSEFGGDGDSVNSGADGERFVSTLAAIGQFPDGAVAGSSGPVMDPSRLHVVWSMSKDFGSSGVRMVGYEQYRFCPNIPLPASLLRPLF